MSLHEHFELQEKWAGERKNVERLIKTIREDGSWAVDVPDELLHAYSPDALSSLSHDPSQEHLHVENDQASVRPTNVSGRHSIQTLHSLKEVAFADISHVDRLTDEPARNRSSDSRLTSVFLKGDYNFERVAEEREAAYHTLDGKGSAQDNAESDAVRSWIQDRCDEYHEHQYKQNSGIVTVARAQPYKAASWIHFAYPWDGNPNWGCVGDDTEVDDSQEDEPDETENLLSVKSVADAGSSETEPRSKSTQPLRPFSNLSLSSPAPSFEVPHMLKADGQAVKEDNPKNPKPTRGATHRRMETVPLSIDIRNLERNLEECKMVKERKRAFEALVSPTMEEHRPLGFCVEIELAPQLLEDAEDENAFGY